MGKATGFLEYERVENPGQEPLERIKTYREFHTPLSPEERQKQGARCMDCGVPFCQNGKPIMGMVSGCPLNNLCPEWNELVYKGRMEDAARRLLLTNCFPEFTSRVCPALCEKACTCGLYGDPVTVKENEYAIIESAYESGFMKPRIPKVRTGKKVAVIGSGPSGLAAALQLNRRGHSVTVYEREDRVGGLLMYGIPNMKLEKTVIDRRIALMEQEGVVFQTGVDVGKDLSAEEIQKQYDAVVLACGSSNPRNINAPGRESKGIYYAVEFLKATTKSLINSNLSDGYYISAKYKNVIVIGGGDTGSDCLGTSIRQGAKDVTVLQIMPKEPAERPANQPWPTFARLYQKTTSMAEGGEYLYNTDSVNFIGTEEEQAKVSIEHSTTATGFVADERGHVTGLKVVTVAPGKDGPFTRQPGTERVLPADLVLISVGFLHPDTTTIVDQLPVELDGRGNIARDDKFATSQNGVFVCGDAGRGQSLVVWAIAEGRSCAAAVDEYLSGEAASELPSPIKASDRPMALPR